MGYKVYSPAVKRIAEVTAFQDLSAVPKQYIWYKTPRISLEPFDWKFGDPYPADARPYRKHTGVDIAGKRGEPIYAVFGGRVWVAPDNNGWYYVHITTESGIIDRYYHLDTILVKTGDILLNEGIQIGTMGDKGKATAVHLHFNSTLADGTTIDAFPRLLGEADAYNRPVDPEGSRRNEDGRLELENTDPYETGIASAPVAYIVNTGGARLNVRKRPGVNFELTGKSLADGEVVWIDRWCNYEHDFNGNYLQSWGRIAGQPWNWVALRYGSWNVKRA